MQRKNRGKRALLIALCVVLALVLLIMATGAWYLNKLFRAIPRVEKADLTPLSSQEISQLEQNQETDPVEPDFTGEELRPEDVVWTTQPAPTAPKRDEIINILLIGQDRRPGEGRQRSDAMILCTLNLDKKMLVLTSFLRDTYVQYPDGYSDHRLNTAYQWGGMPLLDKTLEMNFGVHVDGNFEVDFKSFEKLIDMLGGVQITLTNAEANHLSKQGYSVYAGTQRLNGKEALSYSRLRKIDSDFGRTNRQRKVIMSLLQSCKSSDISTLMAVLESALGMVTTDMSDQQIMSLATRILPILGQLEISSQHIPADGTYKNARIKGMSVLVPDLEENRNILIQTLLEP